MLYSAMLNNMKQNMGKKTSFEIQRLNIHANSSNSSIFILHRCALVKVNLGNIYINSTHSEKTILNTVWHSRAMWPNVKNNIGAQQFINFKGRDDWKRRVKCVYFVSSKIRLSLLWHVKCSSTNLLQGYTVKTLLAYISVHLMTRWHINVIW